MLINIQDAYRFKAKLYECTRKMIFLCLLPIKECMHSTWSIPPFSRTKPQYRWSSESWLCLTMTSQKPGLSSFLENFISPYTCKYMYFISRGWGHGLLGKVTTSKHENLNSITDAHIKKTGYRYEPVSEHWGRRPAGQSVQSNQLAFSSAAIPVSKSKVEVLRRRSGGKVIAAQARKPGFRITALKHRPGLAAINSVQSQ